MRTKEYENNGCENVKQVKNVNIISMRAPAHLPRSAERHTKKHYLSLKFISILGLLRRISGVQRTCEY